MIYQLTPTALPVDETFSLAIDDASVVETQKITVADLLAPADARRAAANTDIIDGMGTEATTGTYIPEDTTPGLASNDFVAAALDANLFNADILLANRIETLQNQATKFYFTTLTADQVKAMDATRVSILPAPGAGLFNYIKRIFVRLNFNTTAYTLPGAGKFYLSYDTLAKEIIEIPSTFLSSAVLVKNAFIPDAALDMEIATNEAIFIESNFGAELTLGDSPIDIIVEYETLTDFSSASTPATNATCLQPYTGTFDNTKLTGTGNLEIVHNLNSTKIMSVIITDNNGVSVAAAWSLGDETGADTLNEITVAIGAIAGTWNYAIIVNVC